MNFVVGYLDAPTNIILRPSVSDVADCILIVVKQASLAEGWSCEP